jgi:hypothetical protein
MAGDEDDVYSPMDVGDEDHVYLPMDVDNETSDQYAPTNVMDWEPSPQAGQGWVVGTSHHSPGPLTKYQTEAIPPLPRQASWAEDGCGNQSGTKPGTVVVLT